MRASGGPRRVVAPNVLGCLYMAGGSLGYVANDAILRHAIDRGADAFQVLFMRGVVVSLVFAAACEVSGSRLRRATLSPALLARVVCETGAAALFFLGLVHLEFANAQTILMVVPFVVTVCAAIFLGERVSASRYVAVLVGFGGVVVVVRPATDRFSAWSLVIAASAGFLVGREFATRRIPTAVPAQPVALFTALAVMSLTGTVSIFTGWGELNTRTIVSVLAASLCVVFAYVCTIESVRVGDMSVSAPFRYTSVVAAVVLGRVVFDERLDALSLAGIALIVASGAYSAHAERRRSAFVPAPAPPVAGAGSRGHGSA